MSIGESKQVVADGCYLIRYVPAEPSADVLFFEGTARVLRVAPDGTRDPEHGQLQASGDLYARLRKDPDLSRKDSKEWRHLDPATQHRTDKEESIPIFPRGLYRYYL